jgi:capsular exopolysaccharide synthesis family protein
MVAKRDTEIGLTNRVEADGIEMLDRASAPQDPVFPPKPMLLALGLIAGLSLGSVLALSIDFRDSRLRGLLDLERALAPYGIPVLGQLPLLSPDSRLGAGNARAQRRQRDLYANLFPQSLMAERCRGIRTSIAFVQGADPAKTIMVTSPSSSEGKSSTAMNLALSFSQAGKRVLIIDADMRRPRLHQIFDFDADTAGLAAVLTGTAELEDTILHGVEGAHENLHLLPCGKVPENPAELLDSGALRRLLAELQEQFDVVLLDSPPVLPVADPLILAGKVDGVVVVTRCDQTTGGELQRALSQLAQGDANMLGIVLNEVDARAERYDYGGGYYTYRPRETGTD